MKGKIRLNSPKNSIPEGASKIDYIYFIRLISDKKTGMYILNQLITTINRGKFNQHLLRLLCCLLLAFSLNSCKTSFSIYKEPQKISPLPIAGICLVNRLFCDIELANEEQLTETAMKQLVKAPGVGFRDIKYLKTDTLFRQPIAYVPQPEIMDILFRERDFKYLINIRVGANRYKKGGISIGNHSGYLDHWVSSTVTVYETETSRQVYKQEVTLSEHRDTGTGEPDDASSNFQFTYSTEKLLKKAVKKSAADIERSIRLAVKEKNK